jgi:hypothetical protein
MAEEMMLENLPWESDESEDIESDEAMTDAEDSVEDIGERARRRGKGHYRRVRGVRGMVLRGQDGRARNVPFPTKLATTEETNRGLAGQEIARRAVENRLDRVETRFRAQLKRDSATAGLVFLALGVPLTAWGAIKPTQTGSSSRLGNWAAEGTTKAAAFASATQLATSGAKLMINGQYHRSGIGVAADVFAGAQLAAFAYGAMHQPEQYRSEENHAAALANIRSYSSGDRIVTEDDGRTYQLEVGASGNRFLRLLI